MNETVDVEEQKPGEDELLTRGSRWILENQYDALTAQARRLAVAKGEDKKPLTERELDILKQWEQIKTDIGAEQATTMLITPPINNDPMRAHLWLGGHASIVANIFEKLKPINDAKYKGGERLSRSEKVVLDTWNTQIIRALGDKTNALTALNSRVPQR